MASQFVEPAKLQTALQQSAAANTHNVGRFANRALSDVNFERAVGSKAPVNLQLVLDEAKKAVETEVRAGVNYNITSGERTRLTLMSAVGSPLLGFGLVGTWRSIVYGATGGIIAVAAALIVSTCLIYKIFADRAKYVKRAVERALGALETDFDNFQKDLMERLDIQS